MIMELYDHGQYKFAIFCTHDIHKQIYARRTFKNYTLVHGMYLVRITGKTLSNNR